MARPTTIRIPEDLLNEIDQVCKRTETGPVSLFKRGSKKRVFSRQAGETSPAIPKR